MEGKLSAIVRTLRDNILASNLGYAAVYIGDETLIPATPAVSILAGPLTRNPAETGFTSMNVFDATFRIYHAKLGAQHLNRLECIEIAEDLEEFLLVDKTLGGMLYTSHCTSIEPGFSELGQQIMVSTQVNWQGRSKTRI